MWDHKANQMNEEITRERAIHLAIDFCKKNKITVPRTVHATVYVGNQNEIDFVDIVGVRWKVFFTHKEDKNIPEDYFTKRELKKIDKQERAHKTPAMEGPFDTYEPITIIVHPNSECTRKILS